MEFSAGVHLGTTQTYFVAYQNAESPTDHGAFAGRYVHGGAGIGLRTPFDFLGVTVGIDVAKGVQNHPSDPCWTVISFTGEAQVGLGLPTCIPVSASGGFGTTRFLNHNEVGTPKNALQKIGSMINLLPILF